MSLDNYIIIDDTKYCCIDDLIKIDPLYFGDIKNSPRTIVNKKKLNELDYIYAYHNAGKWIKSQKSYKHSKILVTFEWIYSNVPLVIKFQNQELEKKISTLINEINQKDTKISNYKSQLTNINKKLKQYIFRQIIKVNKNSYINDEDMNKSITQQLKEDKKICDNCKLNIESWKQYTNFGKKFLCKYMLCQKKN